MMGTEQLIVFFATAFAIAVTGYVAWEMQKRSKVRAARNSDKARSRAMSAFGRYLEVDRGAQHAREQLVFDELATIKEDAIYAVSFAVFDVVRWDDARWRITVRHQHFYDCQYTLETEWVSQEHAESFAYAWRYEKCADLVRRLRGCGEIRSSVMAPM